MKKEILTLLSLILIIAFVSCGNDSNKEGKKETTDTDVTSTIDTTDLSTATLDESEKTGTYNLLYNFKEGETNKFRFSSISKSKRDVVMDTAFTDYMEQTITRIVEIKTVKENDDSTAELQCTLKSASVDASRNEEKVRYRSDEEHDTLEVRKFYEFESMLNNPFNIKVKNNGVILEIMDVENILKRMIEISGRPDTLGLQERLAIEESIKQKLILPLMTQIIREFPENKIEIGTSWDKQLSPSNFMSFTLNHVNHYKVEDFQKFEGNMIAVINGNTTTDIKGDTKITQRGVSYEFTKPVTSASGKIFFNLGEGLIQKSKTKTSIEISYSMKMMVDNKPQQGKANEISINENILELL